MFGFVQLVAKAFMRSGKTRPPNIAGTPSSLIAIRGEVWHECARNACSITLKRPHPVRIYDQSCDGRHRFLSDSPL
jgi:hypothetical protein